MTSQVYQMSLFNPSDQWTSFAADFRAKLSQLRESGKDFPILEVLLFFEIARFATLLQPKFYSLRTSGIAQSRRRGYVRDDPPNAGWIGV